MKMRMLPAIFSSAKLSTACTLLAAAVGVVGSHSGVQINEGTSVPLGAAISVCVSVFFVGMWVSAKVTSLLDAIETLKTQLTHLQEKVETLEDKQGDRFNRLPCSTDTCHRNGTTKL